MPGRERRFAVLSAIRRAAYAGARPQAWREREREREREGGREREGDSIFRHSHCMAAFRQLHLRCFDVRSTGSSVAARGLQRRPTQRAEGQATKIREVVVLPTSKFHPHRQDTRTAPYKSPPVVTVFLGGSAEHGCELDQSFSTRVGVGE